MSSSAPYKSRLLNFLNRQAIQVNDKLAKTLRYVALATEWGAQIILYPLYLAVQSGRATRKQLVQKLQTNSFLLSGKETEEHIGEITVDRPLESVLITISPWLLTEGKTDSDESDRAGSETRTVNLITSESATIIERDRSFQGIASSIDDRHLVLVDLNNQICDILTLEQQQQIQKQIVLEVAVYKYQKRCQAAIEKQQSLQYLPCYEIDRNVDSISLPKRLIWEATNWIQTSQLATSLDIFGESNIVGNISKSFPDRQLDNFLAKLDLAEIANNLDDTLVKLEEGAILPLSDKIGSKLQVFGRDRSIANSNSGETATDPFQIKAIILAAIEYFFSEAKNNSTASTSNNIARDRALNRENIEDTWLVWEDLYFEDRSQQTKLPNLKSKLPHSATSSNSLPAANMPKQNNNAAAKKITQNLAKQQNRAIQPTSRRTSQLAKKTPNNSSLTAPTKEERQRNSSAIDRQQEYLETEAKPAGYVKHPLEIILAGLDRAILWLEELFINIWRWLKRRF